MSHAIGLWKDLAKQAERNVTELERLRDALKKAAPGERAKLIRAFRAQLRGDS